MKNIAVVMAHIFMQKFSSMSIYVMGGHCPFSQEPRLYTVLSKPLQCLSLRWPKYFSFLVTIVSEPVFTNVHILQDVHIFPWSMVVIFISVTKYNTSRKHGCCLHFLLFLFKQYDHISL